MISGRPRALRKASTLTIHEAHGLTVLTTDCAPRLCSSGKHVSHLPETLSASGFFSVTYHPAFGLGMRSSKQDALSDDEFSRLLMATDDLRDPFDKEAMFILVCGGRLGMRAGEICHFQSSWVNHNRGLIDIPMHEPCDCGYCQSCATQSHRKSGVDTEEDFAERWKPKTPDSARSIPFTFNDRVAAVIELFFEEFDEYPHSRVSVNRRIDRVAEAAGMDTGDVYPHCLRATAATHHAYRGVPPVALQSMFGWAQLSVARHYIRMSGGATKDALDEVYSD